jgi:hypothetical protein
MFRREFVKKISIALCLVLVCFSSAALSDDNDLDKYISQFTYLKTKGFNAKYLEDGLVGLAEALRGDTAREFVK